MTGSKPLIVPGSILYDAALAPGQRLMYAKLVQMCAEDAEGRTRVTNIQLARMFCISIDTACAWVQTFIVVGAIKVEYTKVDCRRTIAINPDYKPSEGAVIYDKRTLEAMASRPLSKTAYYLLGILKEQSDEEGEVQATNRELRAAAHLIDITLRRRLVELNAKGYISIRKYRLPNGRLRRKITILNKEE